jgi:2-iminobutanoate/2-iminopropanoate deaminase
VELEAIFLPAGESERAVRRKKAGAENPSLWPSPVYLFISGHLPIYPKTGKIPDSTNQGQTKQPLDNLEAILAAEGLTTKDVVKTEVFLKDMQAFPEMNAVYAERFNDAIKPARVTIQAAKLPMDARIEISCIALR